MSLVAPQYSLEFSQRHEEHPCVIPLIVPSETQSLNVRTQSWGDLVHFGSCRINQIKSVREMSRQGMEDLS